MSVNTYRLKTVCNLLIRQEGGEGEGKERLARVAVVEDMHRELHLVLLDQEGDPESDSGTASYLESYLMKKLPSVAVGS